MRPLLHLPVAACAPRRQRADCTRDRRKGEFVIAVYRMKAKTIKYVGGWLTLVPPRNNRIRYSVRGRGADTAKRRSHRPKWNEIIIALAVMCWNTYFCHAHSLFTFYSRFFVFASSRRLSLSPNRSNRMEQIKFPINCSGNWFCCFQFPPRSVCDNNFSVNIRSFRSFSVSFK